MDNDIVSERNDKAPEERNIRPEDQITRAEALAMLMNASPSEFAWMDDYQEFYETGVSGSGYKNAHSFGADWQSQTFYEYVRKVVKNDVQLHVDPRANEPATRADIFEFAYNILARHKMASNTGIDESSAASSDSEGIVLNSSVNAHGLTEEQLDNLTFEEVYKMIEDAQEILSELGAYEEATVENETDETEENETDETEENETDETEESETDIDEATDDEDAATEPGETMAAQNERFKDGAASAKKLLMDAIALMQAKLAALEIQEDVAESRVVEIKIEDLENYGEKETFSIMVGQYDSDGSLIADAHEPLRYTFHAEGDTAGVVSGEVTLNESNDLIISGLKVEDGSTAILHVFSPHHDVSVIKEIDIHK